jgi:RNA polymerase sigma factor (sigma-70 family)
MSFPEVLATFHGNPSDSAAWERIVESVYNPLLSYVASLLVTFRAAPGETAYDIVHDVLLSFQQRWPQSGNRIDSEASLHRYLKQSCKNLLIDRYRHQKTAEQLMDYLALNFSNAFPAQRDLYRSIFLREIVNLLPENCASLLRTYIEEDLTPAEMAEREGVAAAAFYSRWYRCLEKASVIFLQKKPALKR